MIAKNFDNGNNNKKRFETLEKEISEIKKIIIKIEKTVIKIYKLFKTLLKKKAYLIL